MASHIPLYIWVMFFAIVVFLNGLIVAGVAKASATLGQPPEAGRQQVGRIQTWLMAWLVLTAGLAITGFLLNFQGLPPRFLVVLLPAFIVAVWLAHSAFGGMLIAGL